MPVATMCRHWLAHTGTCRKATPLLRLIKQYTGGQQTPMRTSGAASIIRISSRLGQMIGSCFMMHAFQSK